MGLYKRMEEKGMNMARNEETLRAVQDTLQDEELSNDEQFGAVVIGLLSDISTSLADIADSLRGGQINE